MVNSTLALRKLVLQSEYSVRCSHDSPSSIARG